MSPTQRVEIEQIVDAYRATGSVWKAARLVGICGQSVHERLRAIGYPLGGREWTEEELGEVAALLGEVPMGEIARRLGRTYQAVALKVSRGGLTGRAAPRTKKLPRGAGLDKVSVGRYIRQIEAADCKVTTFARRQGLSVELLCRAIEQHFPEWWADYRRENTYLEERSCTYCGATFFPGNSRQVTCTRKCNDTRRRDESYFGGNRRNTIGLDEGICQLCGRRTVKGLSSHHIFGKENDPENASLIALCSGCHKTVTLLGSRSFVDDEATWEALISLVWLRKHGARLAASNQAEPDLDLSVTVSISVSPATAEEVAEAKEAS